MVLLGGWLYIQKRASTCKHLFHGNANNSWITPENRKMPGYFYSPIPREKFDGLYQRCRDLSAHMILSPFLTQWIFRSMDAMMARNLSPIVSEKHFYTSKS